MRSLLSFVTISSALILVSGCSGNPGPMPRGYSSFDKVFKSVDGPKARAVGYEYSNEKNMEVMGAMQAAAESLAQKLDQKLSFSVDQVELKIPANTTFYNSFDHVLRDELIKRGYLLTTSAKDSVPVELVAKHADPSCEDDTMSDDAGRVYLALAIDEDEDGAPKDIVGGYYTLPLYGFKSVNNVDVDPPVCGGIIDVN